MDKVQEIDGIDDDFDDFQSHPQDTDETGPETGPENLDFLLHFLGECESVRGGRFSF